LVCNGNYDSSTHEPLFKSFRKLLERRYRRNVTRSLLRHLRSEHFKNEKVVITHPFLPNTKINVASWTRHLRLGSVKSGKLWELKRDIEVGRDAISRSSNSTWWSWDSGSTLFYWRWPRRCQKSVRDGTKLFVDWTKMPRYMKRQKWPHDADQRQKLMKKVNKVRGRGYVQPGFVKSLTGFFAVPKAGTDIRVVYDATQCGLNDALWAPNFFLPTVDSILRNASSATWFGDLDLGEMFLNYALDLDLRPYAGIDVTELEADSMKEGIKRIFERWSRTLMGFKPSPYICTQTFAWSEEIINGDPSDVTNPFYWDKVILNLPGQSDYDPTMPKVYKWNSVEDCMASFYGTYIDDVRSGGSSELACRDASRRIASRINYLGQQDAVRKRGHAAKSPRAWAGAKCIANAGDGLYVLSTEAKWDKSKTIVSKWLLAMESHKEDLLSYSELEKDVGFMCHMSRTYPSTFPYLKGFYNTLNGWRVDRDKEGWKIGRVAWLELISGDVAFENESDVELTFESRKRNFMKLNKRDKPEAVSASPRFLQDLRALNRLFEGDTPKLRLVRGVKVGMSLFGFGDASGSGFGSSWEGKEGIGYRFGTWGDSMNLQSSNLRELKNLVDTLSEMGNQGALKGTEVYLFTDNSTSEAAFHNGTSTSLKLFELVLEIKDLELKHGAIIHLCHVSGERMKAQGSDGLSRGNLNVGVMAGKSMLEFVPLHLNALQRHPPLKAWIESWTGDDRLEWLTPKQWFRRGHDLVENSWEVNIDGMKMPRVKSGFYVWTPPPFAAEAVVEELRKARHKRQKSHHLFVLPRLLQPQWRKQLYKAADLVVTLPPGHSAWPTNMFEPLTIVFIFPYLSYRPWQLRGSIRLLALGRELSRLWRDNLSGEGPVLRELWGVQRSICKMPEKLARKVLLSEQPSEVQSGNTRKRRRCEVAKEEGRVSLSKQQKR
jgi:hypothetical protein